MKRIALSVAVVASMSSVGSAQQFAQPPRASQPSQVQPQAQTKTVRSLVHDRLAAHRTASLAAFQAYVDARVYPSNTMTTTSLDVWRDAEGHLCAAATIIDKSGQHALVQHVAETDNNLRLATVTDGPIESWILASGLTQDELVAIQEPFRPVVEQPNHPVDPDLRTAETDRLNAKYKTIENDLASERAAALDAATDRAMQHADVVAELERDAERVVVRSRLAETRDANIAAFAAYVDGRIYPSNTMTAGAVNVWRDTDGHLCAAATIIDSSGQHDLVKTVAETENDLRLATVTDGPIENWILESGLTQEELVAIQLPFDPVTRGPNQPIDPGMRQTETARLEAAYHQIETQLATETDAALDTATDRVMQHADLAAQLAAPRIPVGAS